MALLAIKLCADDYGLTPAVSRGIVEAVAARRLTATSAMTTRSDWLEAARDIAPYAGQIEIGLHLNLTLGAPLSSMPQFAPGGALPTIGGVIAATRRNDFPQAEIRAEIARQLDQFEAGLGRPPDFVDGHQHAHLLAPIRTSLIAELESRRYSPAPWLRDSTDDVFRILSRRVEWPKALAIAWIGRGFRQAAKEAGFATNQGFSGFSSFAAVRDYGSDFSHYLVAPGPQHLIMCHPGHVDDALAALDPVTASRENELAFLLSDRFPEILAAYGINLGGHSTG